MIFYFSGTGNSFYAAKQIAEHIHEPLVSIAAAVNSGSQAYKYTLKDREAIGFVFPTHSWGPPKIVLDFLEGLELDGYDSHYMFGVATCGGNIGNAMDVVNRQLKRKGMELSSGFSIVMPNNYIIMGDVDSKERQEAKLSAAEKALESIREAVMDRQRGVFRLKKGFPARLLTGVVHPMFVKNGIQPAKFHATDSCQGCETCEKVCGSGNIAVDGKPEWGSRCTLCLACLHYCPVQAIQYGKSTERKGRYTNRNVSIKEIIGG
ncbi:EFR1 family ferrodoxin [Gorillibacterium sp. sgz5001074]|uniref:EFR1 family ferrodoxin n=1 Tax=Gorillibacterium sp. sgz5001074 TaxID=3446695 RepID=UPI003F6631BC